MTPKFYMTPKTIAEVNAIGKARIARLRETREQRAKAMQETVALLKKIAVSNGYGKVGK